MEPLLANSTGSGHTSSLEVVLALVTNSGSDRYGGETMLVVNVCELGEVTDRLRKQNKELSVGWYFFKSNFLSLWTSFHCR